MKKECGLIDEAGDHDDDTRVLRAGRSEWHQDDVELVEFSLATASASLATIAREQYERDRVNFEAASSRPWSRPPSIHGQTIPQRALTDALGKAVAIVPADEIIKFGIRHPDFRRRIRQYWR